MPSKRLLLTLFFSGHNLASGVGPWLVDHDIRWHDAEDGHAITNSKSQDIIGKLQAQPPIGMRKMSSDEGEMFFLDYWSFDHLGGRALRLLPAQHHAGDGSSGILNPPILHHSGNGLSDPGLHLIRKLFKRDFQCPSGTSNCASIGQPNSCCTTTETCIQVTDTGLGPVGCCPRGQDCGGRVAGCNKESGFTECPNSPNRGCCIPGYTCQGIGCVKTGTPITTSVDMVGPAQSNTWTPSIQTVTSTVVITASTSAVPTTTTQTVIVTISPSISSASVTTTSMTGVVSPSAQPPVRPTGDSSGTIISMTTTAAPSATANPDGCPFAFYRCSAYYVGGCCRIGRDCSSTSCPAGSSTTIASASDRTIVASAGATLTVEPGTCASGWAACPSDVGGGCCPRGFGCGPATCTAGIDGASDVPKQGPSSLGTRLGGPRLWLVVILLFHGIGTWTGG